MAETSKQQTKRKNAKKYYVGGKKRKKDKLAIGMHGILLFGADHETQAKREAFNLLNEYADELYGTEILDYVPDHGVDKKLIVDYQHGVDETVIVKGPGVGNSGEEEDEDIEKAIAKEIDQINNAKKDRRFQGVETGVHAIIFIKSTLSKEKINELVHSILSDVEKTKKKKARSFQRLIPVTEICPAEINSIRKTVTEKFLPDFNDDKNAPLKFCIHFKSRYNDTVTRNQVLTQIAAVFMESDHTVDLQHPDKVIVVEIMKGLCCMSVLNDFFKFKKYNIHAIANENKPAESSVPQDSSNHNTEVEVEGEVPGDSSYFLDE